MVAPEPKFLDVSNAIGKNNEPSNNDSTAAVKKPQKRKAESEKPNDEPKKRRELEIILPKELLSCLDEDWKAINKENKLIDLPARLTVKDIIDSYVQAMNVGGKHLEFTKFLEACFTEMLDTHLLYGSERLQLLKLRERYPDKQTAEMYGPFHLLRMFLVFGEQVSDLVPDDVLDERSIDKFFCHVKDFLDYLDENKEVFFRMNHFAQPKPRVAW